MGRSRISSPHVRGNLQTVTADKPLTRWAGGQLVQKALDILGINTILAELGIQSRGYDPAAVVLNFVLGAWMKVSSVMALAHEAARDGLIAKIGAPAHRTTLTRKLSLKRFDWATMYRRLAYTCWKTLTIHPNATVALVIDDTTIEKYGKKMDGASWVYDSSQKKRVWGYNIVTAALVAEGHRVVVDFAIWQKNGPTKYALALEIIRRLREAGIKFDLVLFDGWYGRSKDFLNALPTFWVTRLGEDMVVEVGDRRITVKELIGQTQEHPGWLRVHRAYPNTKYRTVRAYLPEYGDVTLVVVHDRWDQEAPYRVLAANDPRMQGWGVIDFYLLRWEIENIHREAKSQLGLANFHVQKLHAIEGHIAFTFTAMLVAALLHRYGPTLQETGITAIRRMVIAIAACVTGKRRLRLQLDESDRETLETIGRALEALAVG